MDLEIELLEKRRTFNDVLWFHTLLNTQIDCPELKRLKLKTFKCLSS